MLTHSRHLISLVDAAVAGQHSMGSVGPAVTDARLELMVLVEKTRQSIETWKAGAAAASSYEFQNLQTATAQALAMLDSLTDTGWQTGFEIAVDNCLRWVGRAQTEACTAAGPTSLPLVNMALRAHDRRARELLAPALASVLEQCETLLASSDPGREHDALQVLARVVACPLDPDRLQPQDLVSAATAVERARIQSAHFTPWPTLNRALSAAFAVVCEVASPSSFETLFPLAAGEMRLVQQKVCQDPAPGMEAVLSEIQADFAALEYWLRQVQTAVRGKDANQLGAAVRRLGWVLSDLATHKGELEVVEVQSLEADPRSKRIMTANVQKVVQAAQAFADGRGSVDELSDAIVGLHTSIEEAVGQAQANPDGIRMDLFNQGVQSLQQALSQWSLLLGGSRDQLQAGLEHAYTGIKQILESQQR